MWGPTELEWGSGVPVLKSSMSCSLSETTIILPYIAPFSGVSPIAHMGSDCDQCWNLCFFGPLHDIPFDQWCGHDSHVQRISSV